MKELILIQSELKAPKNQHNKFGNYNYRSAEDILEALKPLLLKHECLLTINDEIISVCDRIYVQATAMIVKGESSVSTTAFAREELQKKGMDASQITGSASSYARKYALNGLFLIDDTKDADATNTHDKPEPAKKLAKGTVIAKLENCTSLDELKTLWTQVADADKEELQDTFSERKKQLS